MRTSNVPASFCLGETPIGNALRKQSRYSVMPEACKWCGKAGKLEHIEAYGWLCEDCIESVEMNEKTAQLDEGSDDF